MDHNNERSQFESSQGHLLLRAMNDIHSSSKSYITRKKQLLN